MDQLDEKELPNTTEKIIECSFDERMRFYSLFSRSFYPNVSPSNVQSWEDFQGDYNDFGVTENDIRVVMDQASVSRVRALRDNKGDVINSLMELTM
jgi:NACalpha-BTF3-like transcription factor